MTGSDASNTSAGLLDALPIGRRQLFILAMALLLAALDGYDALSMAFVAPALSKDWGLDKATLGLLLSSSLVGMAIGAVGISPFADRIRKQAMIHSDQEITAHLTIAIANASDAAHAHAWEVNNYGQAAPETQVDREYYQDLVSAWSMVAAECGIDTLDALHFADNLVH